MKKILFFILVAVWATFGIAAQKYPMQVAAAKYDFVNYAANRLVFPGDSSKFDRFYDKMDSLALFGASKINIAHIGGSHIQADIFSNRVRMNFANCMPGFASERGVLFPYSAAHSNNPRNYKIGYSGDWTKTQNSRRPVSEKLGITGYAISTNDTDAYISFELNPENYSSDWEYNRLRLFATVTDKNRIPLLVVGTDTVPAVQENNTYVFNLHNLVSNGTVILGKATDYDRYLRAYQQDVDSELDYILENDSLVAGEEESYALNIGSESDNGMIAEESEAVDNEDFLFTISGLLPENFYNGITYHSMGVNGASLNSWLRCDNFEEELAFIKPDLAIMAIGINDANVPVSKFDKYQYKRKYSLLMERIYAVNPDCAVIFITNNDCDYRRSRWNRRINRNGPIVQEAIYELAKEHGAAVWDLFKIMGGLGSIHVWEENGLANRDHIHFLFEGYNLIGDLLYNAIIYDWLYKEKITH